MGSLQGANAIEIEKERQVEGWEFQSGVCCDGCGRGGGRAVNKFTGFEATETNVFDQWMSVFLRSVKVSLSRVDVWLQWLMRCTP